MAAIVNQSATAVETAFADCCSVTSFTIFHKSEKIEEFRDFSGLKLFHNFAAGQPNQLSSL